jgi:hypothetical protein
VTSHYLCIDAAVPKLDREVVGNEQSLARILDELLPQRSAGVQRPENLSTRAVKKARHITQDFALRPFSASWSAHDQIGDVTIHIGGIGISPGKPCEWQTLFDSR